MLTAEGCRSRRQRLWQSLSGQIPGDLLVLADPVNLRYLANCYVDPFALGADFFGILAIKPDGHTTLYHDSRLPKSVELSHVDERKPILWYDGKVGGWGPRRLALLDSLKSLGGRIHDALNDPLGGTVQTTIATMRRQKDADEVALLRRCMEAGKAGQDWARKNVKAGMSELEVYLGIFQACSLNAGQASILYGDFAISPGPSRKGGPPTKQILQDGDMMILDFSVIIQGYRSDYTNTLVVGGKPNAEQQKLYDSCKRAMHAGEKMLKAGNSCLSVYDAVKAAFAADGMAEHFPHHAGHGLGLGHPEAPMLVREANETLLRGDVITLEPGLYIDGVGGIRIEHNYLITDSGYEQLSQHAIELV
jgi:Xaa-Pro aminopeptidase